MVEAQGGSPRRGKHCAFCRHKRWEPARLPAEARPSSRRAHRPALLAGSVDVGWLHPAGSAALCLPLWPGMRRCRRKKISMHTLHFKGLRSQVAWLEPELADRGPLVEEGQPGHQLMPNVYEQASGWRAVGLCHTWGGGGEHQPAQQVLGRRRCSKPRCRARPPRRREAKARTARMKPAAAAAAARRRRGRGRRSGARPRSAARLASGSAAAG